MPARKPSRKAKKKLRFRQYSFRISDTEKARYDRLCAYEHIGFRQLVKKALREYYKNADLEDIDTQLENQLDLFGPVDLFGQPVQKKR
ncbi:MAG: hypothetical protein NC396_02000 [Bacteroides sp.]|nr:hypothetical protein [Bacteroides sp.]MCM1084964.1 hypothetical protein [Bacteroides sp.]